MSLELPLVLIAAGVALATIYFHWRLQRDRQRAQELHDLAKLAEQFVDLVAQLEQQILAERKAGQTQRDEKHELRNRLQNVDTALKDPRLSEGERLRHAIELLRQQQE